MHRMILRIVCLPGLFFLLSTAFAANNNLQQKPATAHERILILGDSISAGYGISMETAWATLLQQRLAAQQRPWQVVNASISGETTDGGLRRLPQLLAKWQPRLVIIELGGNDGLRGFPLQTSQDNLLSMIRLAKENGARILLVGMQLFPNYGPRYTQAFTQIFHTLAQAESVALLPFFLADIYDQPGMLQADGIHPTSQAQPQLLESIWTHLLPLL